MKDRGAPTRALLKGLIASLVVGVFATTLEVARLIRLAFAVCQAMLFVTVYGLLATAQRAMIPATVAIMQNVVRCRITGFEFIIVSRNLFKEPLKPLDILSCHCSSVVARCNLTGLISRGEMRVEAVTLDSNAKGSQILRCFETFQGWLDAATSKSPSIGCSFPIVHDTS
ncbi:MAG TPA: hypothetical protein VFD30_22740 [Terriglobia bacterium]|nr:hypothetical protein [Terriglobia bacterium]